MRTTKYRLNNDGPPLVVFERTKFDAEYILQDVLDGRSLDDLTWDEKEEVVAKAEQKTDEEALLPGWYHALDFGPITGWDTGPFDTEVEAMEDIPRTYGRDVIEGPEPDPADTQDAFVRAHLARLIEILYSAPRPDAPAPR